MERFIRHTQLTGFGAEAQQKLERAKVLVVGAGGLGAPVLMQLAAMGVGKLGIVDGDTVSLSNLHRQLIYTEADLNQPKAICAARRLSAMNGQLKCSIHQEYLNASLALEIIPEFDVVVDCTDSIPVRYLVNDVCVLHQKPLVYGAIFQYEGQVACFNLPEGRSFSANYRDLFPDETQAANAVNCNEAGVLGILPNIIGSFMALETVKIITGFSPPLCNELYMYEIRNHQSYRVGFAPRQATYRPDSVAKILNHDYAQACIASDFQISAARLFELASQPDTQMVDVREQNEEPELEGLTHVRIPLAELAENLHALTDFKTLIFICKSGARSAKAVTEVQKFWPEKALFCLEGGIELLASTKQHAAHINHDPSAE